MKETIKKEIKYFEDSFKNYLTPKVDDFVMEFVFRKSKRLRPLLGLLFLKSLDIKLTNAHWNLLYAVELIHNASLIHDDIIDKSSIRRENPSLNEEFDNSLAVVAGDLLLALGMKNIVNTDNKSVQELCSDSMAQMCKGEINQYFSKFKLPKLDEYIKKSKQKTALLFKISILGSVMISEKKEYYKAADDFSENFGIAFQIKNDLKNSLESKDDFNQGIYTAYDIFETDKPVEKTKILINNYLDRALDSIRILPDNIYSNAIKYLTNEMREINE